MKKKLTYPTWWKQILAHATMTRIKSVLKEERDPNLPEKRLVKSMNQQNKGNWPALG
jgi:hypothetical protein